MKTFRVLILNLLSLSNVLAAPINIAGIDRAALIQELYKQSTVIAPAHRKFQGEPPTEISYKEAESLVGEYIDYLNGKLMKIKVPAASDGDEIESWGYDRDNGQDAAKAVVDRMSRN